MYHIPRETYSHPRAVSSGIDPLQHCNTILFDTCAILEEKAFVSCMRNILPLLGKGKQLLIPQSVMKELHYLAHASSSTCRTQALKAEQDLQALAHTNAIRFTGDPDDTEHTDHFLLRYAATHCFDSRLLIVTQDGNLIRDLEHLDQVTSKVGAPVVVRKLDSFGGLVQKQDKPSQAERDIRAVLRRYGIS